VPARGLICIGTIVGGIDFVIKKAANDPVDDGNDDGDCETEASVNHGRCSFCEFRRRRITAFT
jgi:hypothetical protein